ncbi:MAG: hypothetical protein U5J95_02645 [Balneolaceae bacterium]|nr:hypothetical protein [Balneolaceae bacterium]
MYDSNIKNVVTLKIKSNYFDELDNPPVKPVKKNKALGVNWLFQHIYLHADGSIFFTVKKTLYKLNSSNEGNYKISGKFQFLISGKTLNIRQLLFHDNHLYLSSAFNEFIYKIPLDSINF